MSHANRPRVLLSWAQSLDGRIATSSGDSRGLSSMGALERTHRFRAEHSSILIGIGTALADDPSLTCRLPDGCPAQPLRVIIDRQCRLPLSSRLIRTAREHALAVIHGPCDSLAMTQRRDALSAAGARTMEISLRDNHIDLAAALAALAEIGMDNVMVEGGQGVLTAFLATGLWDELAVFVVPRIMGNGVEAIGALGIETVAGSIKLRGISTELLDGDVLWRLVPDQASRMNSSQQ